MSSRPSSAPAHRVQDMSATKAQSLYGLFSPPVSLAPDADSKFRVPDKCKGKQFIGGNVPVKANLGISYAGDPYIDSSQITKLLSRGSDRTKNIVPAPFKCSNPAPKAGKALGSQYVTHPPPHASYILRIFGLFGGISYLPPGNPQIQESPRSKITTTGPKNFLTSGPIKGGPGVPMIHIGARLKAGPWGISGEYKYVAEPPTTASGSKRDYSKPWVIGSPAKKGGSGVADNKLFFSTSGYSLNLNDVAAASSSMPNSARSRPLTAKTISGKPWRPSSPPKKGLGLSKFPEYISTVKEQSSKEKLETLKQQRAKIIGPAFVPNAHHKSMLTQSIITHPMNISSLCGP